MVQAVGHQQVALSIQRETLGEFQRRGRGRATVRGWTKAAADHGGNGPVAGHLADAVLILVRHVQIVLSVQYQGVDQPQRGCRGRATVPKRAATPVAGDGLDGARRGDPANPEVPAIGNVDVPAGIDRQSPRVAELRAGGGAPVSRKPGGSASGDGGNRSARR